MSDRLQMQQRAVFRCGTLVGVALLACAPLPGLNPAAYAQQELVLRLNPGLRNHTDILVGKNNPGPYNLSWNKIRVLRDAPVTVVVDGVELKPEAFVLDAGKGVITFRKPLSDKSMARVTYLYDPKVSRRNGGYAAAPLTLPVTRLGMADVRVIALPKTDDPNTVGIGAPLIWSIGSRAKLLGGGVNTSFNYAGEEKTALNLGFNRGNNSNGLDIQYLRNDRQFATGVGKSIGIGDALQRFSLATRLTPSKYLGVTYSTNETVNLIQRDAKEQEVYAVRLGGVGRQPLLNYSRVEDTTIAPNQQQTSVTTEKVDLATRMDRMTAISVTALRADTDAPTPQGEAFTKDATVSMTSVSPDKVKQAHVTINSGSKETAGALENRQTVSVRLQPAPVFVVSAAQTEQRVTPVKPDGTNGDPSTVVVQTAALEIIPMPNAKMTTSVAETINNDVKVSTTNFVAHVGAGKPVEVLTSVVNRSTEVPGASVLDTTRAQVALRPAKNVTVTGIYTWNPEENGAIRQAARKELSMNARFGAIELGSGYTLTTLNGIPQADEADPQFGQISLTLGWRFGRFTRLNGSYLDSLRYRDADERFASLVPRYLRTYGLGVTHDLGPAFNFMVNGSVTDDRSNANQPRDVRAEARVGVRF